MSILSEMEKRHPTDEELKLFHRGSFSNRGEDPGEHFSLSEHLNKCYQCRQRSTMIKNKV